MMLDPIIGRYMNPKISDNLRHLNSLNEDDFKKKSPLVTIVLPAYNHGNYLHEAIQSVLDQSYPNIELLVFDDGSVDHTPEVLSSYGKLFFWERHKNIGQSATLNKGWRMSKGEIISYLSADDYLEPTAVQEAVDYLINNDAILVYGDYQLTDADSNVIGKVYAPEFNYVDMLSNIVVQPGPGVFFYKSVFEKVGGWDESLRQIPDYDYWLRLGLVGNFIRIPKFLARYRMHKGSQSYIEPSIEKSEECVLVMKKFYSNNKLPNNIMALESKAKSTAHLVAARFHLRAGRYVRMFRNLKMAYSCYKLSIFSLRIIQLLGNGFLFRIRLFLLGKKRNHV